MDLHLHVDQSLEGRLEELLLSEQGGRLEGRD
jgi:hypothetical protein